jgi:hypothetical protein
MTGLVCNKLTNYNLLQASIASSPFSYLDEFNNRCYNLYILASAYQISDFQQINSIVYDANNCSFNYFKICVKENRDFWPPKFECNSCEAGKFI